MADTRTCEQCGTVFTPRRSGHARFCRARCRVGWNCVYLGDPQAGASGAGVVHHRDQRRHPAAGQGPGSGPWAWVRGDQQRQYSPVTIVDATLVRYHRHPYKSAMKSRAPARRQAIEETFAGLRFVRNRMGCRLDPADFIQPEQSHPGADPGGVTTWRWRPVPEPDLGSLPPRGQAWEVTRYRAYRAGWPVTPSGRPSARPPRSSKLAAPHLAAAWHRSRQDLGFYPAAGAAALTRRHGWSPSSSCPGSRLPRRRQILAGGCRVEDEFGREGSAICSSRELLRR